MDKIQFPRTTSSRFTGKSGIGRISSIVNDNLGWIFRKVELEDDYGIDGFIDIVTDHGGVTGQSFAVQIKYGESYFSQMDNESISFYGENKHLNLYKNTPNPVLIVIGRPGSEFHWQLFDINETEKTKTGWKIDIPKQNIFDTQSKETLLSIIGPPADAVSEAAEHWQLIEDLSTSSIILYHIEPDDIYSLNISNIQSFVERLTSSSVIAKKSQGKLELFTSAFDLDAREIWEIPKMKKWIAATEAADIPWFFLCNTREPNFWLRAYFIAQSNGKRRAKKSADPRIINTKLNKKKFGDTLINNFHRLNKICERIGFSESKIKEISFSSARAAGLPAEVLALSFGSE